MALNLPDGVAVTTFDGPPRGFDLLSADSGDNINQVNSAGTVVVDGNVISPTVIQCLYVGA